MIDVHSYVKVKLKDIEVELKGTEEFVEKHLSNFQDIFNSLSSLSNDLDYSNTSTTKNITPDKLPQKLSIEDILKQDFSIWKKVISDNTDDTVIYIIAAYYIQLRNKENYFSTQEISSLLSQYDIILNNINHCETHNLKIVNITKVGRINIQNKYIVNEETMKLSNEILEFSVNEC